MFYPGDRKQAGEWRGVISFRDDSFFVEEKIYIF